MKRLIILGTADSVFNVPYDDEGYEIWGVGTVTSKQEIKRLDRIVEVHSKKIVMGLKDKGHLYGRFHCPVYVRDVNELKDIITNAVQFPKDEIIKFFGTDYFTNTVGWMLALALYEGYTDITLMGVHMSQENEYAWEKPNAEYWIGRAKERGCRVRIPEDSSIMKQYFLYGFEDPPVNWHQIVSKKLYLERQLKETVQNYVTYAHLSAQLQGGKAIIDKVLSSKFMGIDKDEYYYFEKDEIDNLKTSIYDKYNDKHEKFYEKMEEYKALFNELVGCQKMIELNEEYL